MSDTSYDNHSVYSEYIRPNPWDLIALIIIIAIVVSFAWTGLQMAQPYNLGEQITISLLPSKLPNYALRTSLRMILALGLSLLFTFIIGTLAAKNRKAESIIIPALDVLQAIPVLSFLSITVVGFISLFPGSLLGPECASIFAIFTSQAWNMTFGFYQSLKTLPNDLIEVSKIYSLSKWQKFWRIEVPFATPSLLWNMMMSMSASWFFVVASEAISVSNQDIRLPGVGSYIALAIDQQNPQAVLYAIVCMLIVIILYDQLFFRPFLYWSEKFQEQKINNEKSTKSWFVLLIQKTRLLKYWSFIFSIITNKLLNISILNKSLLPKDRFKIPLNTSWLWNLIIVSLILSSIYILIVFIITALSVQEVIRVCELGLYTAIRVLLLIILCSLIWVPIGVWIGKRPKIAYKIQPFIQFLASFPANLLFPLAVIGIVKYKLNVEIWTAPLMILGCQWYILFNVIVGTLEIPKELHYATDNLGLSGLSWWTKFILPGIFPFYITGAITAAGGAWNASIVAEFVSWGDTTLVASGLGAYIAKYTAIGDFHRTALGTSIMCVYVLLLNKICWQPLYKIAKERMGPL
ncbi:MAG: ABC transporter permease subunit [Legionellales bacterium]|nr:ABC transporter permease subunit [Legionellales bacterium]